MRVLSGLTACRLLFTHPELTDSLDNLYVRFTAARNSLEDLMDVSRIDVMERERLTTDLRASLAALGEALSIMQSVAPDILLPKYDGSGRRRASD
jgi:hypothetical protein